MTKKYFIKNQIIFENNPEKINLFNSNLEIKLNADEKYLNEARKKILDFIKEKQQTTKEYTLNGKLKSPKDTIKKIETHKDKLQTPKEDDYEYIEITSQLDIIEQLISSVSEYAVQIKTFNETLTPILDIQKKVEKTKEQQILENIEIQKKEHSEIQKIITKIEQTEKNPILDTIKELETKKQLNQKKEKEIETKIEQLQKTKDTKNPYEIQLKIDKLNTSIEKDILETKILENRIQTLKQEQKLGKTKKLSLLGTILTLGLIYWTKYSNINYIIETQKLKILKLKEKNLRIKQKILLLEKQEEEKTKNSKNKSLSTKEEKELLIENLEKINAENIKIQKDLTLNKKELEKYEKELSNILEKQTKIDEKIKEIHTIHNEFKETTTEKIEKELENLGNNNKTNLEKLEEYKKDILSQKTTITADGIIEL